MSQEERIAIGTLFNTGWAGQTPVAGPNEDFQPANTTDPWVRWSITNAEPFPLEFGSAMNQSRHPGVVFIQVFVAVNQGDAAARILADTAAAIFRGKQVTAGVNGRILFRSPKITPAGDDGEFYQMNVSVPFIRDELF